MVFIFYFALSLIPVLWIATIYFLRKWKHITIFCLANILSVGVYFFLIFYATFHFFKVDPYGLKDIFLFLYLIIFQTLTTFIFSLHYKYKHK